MKPTRAVLQLIGGGELRIGPERIRLLAAIGEHAALGLAAEAVGLSYKGAWDAVQALNNLFAQPLVETSAGGRGGGGTRITAAGRRVLEDYARLEAAMAQAVAALGHELAGETAPALWSLFMKTSARNALRGVVESVTEGAVNSEVVLRLSPALALVAIVTRTSVAELGLAPGRPALALIKASFVILATGEGELRTSARNQLSGVVSRHEVGAVNDEVTLDLGDGKTLVATITRESAEALGIAVGLPARALIKASHVILAVE